MDRPAEPGTWLVWGIGPQPGLFDDYWCNEVGAGDEELLVMIRDRDPEYPLPDDDAGGPDNLDDSWAIEVSGITGEEVQERTGLLSPGMIRGVMRTDRPERHRRPSEAVLQVQPADDEVREEWIRKTDDPGIRNVSAVSVTPPGDSSGWQVAVWVMEFIRADPLEAEVRRRIADALRRVSGVTSADEQDREQWWVTGTPSGEALVRAAAEVVDDLEDRIRAFMYGGDG